MKHPEPLPALRDKFGSITYRDERFAILYWFVRHQLVNGGNCTELTSSLVTYSFCNKGLTIMISSESRPTKQQGVLTENASGTQLLLNLTNGQYFALNEVGSRVWELCDGQHSVAQIVEIIAEEYDAPRNVIETDVQELLGGLANERLLVTDT